MSFHLYMNHKYFFLKTKMRFRFRRHFAPRLDRGRAETKNENAFLFFVFVGPFGPT